MTPQPCIFHGLKTSTTGMLLLGSVDSSRCILIPSIYNYINFCVLALEKHLPGQLLGWSKAPPPPPAYILSWRPLPSSKFGFSQKLDKSWNFALKITLLLFQSSTGVALQWCWLLLQLQWLSQHQPNCSSVSKFPPPNKLVHYLKI